TGRGGEGGGAGARIPAGNVGRRRTLARYGSCSAFGHLGPAQGRPLWSGGSLDPAGRAYRVGGARARGPAISRWVRAGVGQRDCGLGGDPVSGVAAGPGADVPAPLPRREGESARRSSEGSTP